MLANGRSPYMWFYGTLLRSKTIKLRLKNCPAQARSAGAVLERLVICSYFKTTMAPQLNDCTCYMHSQFAMDNADLYFPIALPCWAKTIFLCFRDPFDF